MCLNRGIPEDQEFCVGQTADIYTEINVIVFADDGREHMPARIFGKGAGQNVCKIPGRVRTLNEKLGMVA